MKKRAITKEDLLKFNFVGDPQVSPNGKLVAHVLTRINEQKNGYFSNIFISTEKDTERLITYNQPDELIKDISPRWRPDGESIAFISNRSGTNQIWEIPLSGGEATPLTNCKHNITEFSWSPDGRSVVFVSEEIDDNNDTEVSIISNIRYKSEGVGLKGNRRKRIYILNINTGNCSPISNVNYDLYQPSFAPDGKSIMFLGMPDDRQAIRYTPSIWKYNLKNESIELLYMGEGSIVSPTFSSDGQWIAFASHNKDEFSAFNLNSSANIELWVLSTTTNEMHNLTFDFDFTLGNFVNSDSTYDTSELINLKWSSDCSSIFFIASVEGSSMLFKADMNGKVSHPLTPNDHSITSFDLMTDNQIVVVLASSTKLGELFLQRIDNQSSCNQMTNFNKALLKEVYLREPEKLNYKHEDGQELEGWILKPYNFDENKKYPMILQIHGGPQTAYGNAFYHELHLMAANGYVVLYTNPRGSHSYGQKFVEACVGDWAGKPYEDIISGLDHVIKNYNFINSDQLFVTGGSYGGYMTNIIVTRTNRFKAAVTQRSICNLYSFRGTSDKSLHSMLWQTGQKDLWDNEEYIMENSPIRYANKVKTPTLIIHSEQDFRCPMEQAEQWFTALSRNGVNTKFIRFPNENHSLSRKGQPKHRLERLEHIVGWFNDTLVKLDDNYE